MKPTSPSCLARLSFWAKKHPVAARWLIAISRIVMGFYAFYWGAVLADVDNDFSNIAFIVSALVYLTGFIFYPRKKNKESRKINFTRQKLCDGLLVLSSCAFWLAAGNYTLNWQPNNLTEPAQTEVLQSAIGKNGKALESPGWEHAEIVKKAKKKRKGIFKKIKKWRVGLLKKLKARVLVKLAIIKSAYRKLDGGTIVLLTLGSIAIFTILGYLTIAASCNLSCSGQEGAATLVAFLGCAITAGLIAWMWSAAIKKNRLKFKEPDKSQPPIRDDNNVMGESQTESAQIEILTPTVRVCLETDDPKGMEDVTVTHNGTAVMSNVPLGKVPICIDLTVQPNIKNSIKVTGASGPVKLSVEDGKVIKRLTLPIQDGQTGGVDLMLMDK